MASESAIEVLQGELERLFELRELLQLSSDVLGFDPEHVGGTASKGAFARALGRLLRRAGRDRRAGRRDPAFVVTRGPSLRWC